MSYSRKSLTNFFKPAYLQRGQKYHQNGHVIDTSELQNGQLIRGTVRGSGGQSYYAQIHLQIKNRLLKGVKGNCSCPVGLNCKHVAAILLANLEQQASHQSEMFGQPSDKWLYQLKAVSSVSKTSPVSSECILYLLDIEQNAAGYYLTVKTVKAKLQKDGLYTEVRDHAANPESQARYIREDDRFVLLLLRSVDTGSGNNLLQLNGSNGSKPLKEMIDTGRCHWQSELNPALKHSDTLKSELSWILMPDARQVIKAKDLDNQYVLLPVTPPYYIDTETGDCGLFDCGLPEDIASQLLSASDVLPNQVDKVSQYLQQNLHSQHIPLPVKPVIEKVSDYTPTPCLQLLNEEDEFSFIEPNQEATGVALLSFDYAGTRVHPYHKTKQFIYQAEHGYEVLQRNTTFESDVLERLDELGFIADDFMYSEQDEALQLEPVHVVDSWLDFMLHYRQQLESEGWSIHVKDEFAFQVDQADQWYADVDQSSYDWFTLELGVEVDGKNINLLPFLVTYLSQLKGASAMEDLRKHPDNFPLLLKQDNGRLLHVPLIKVRHIVDTLIELYDPNVLEGDGTLKLSRFQSNQLTTLQHPSLELSWAGGDKLRKFGERLINFKGINSVPPPVSLKTELRDYQKEGLNWLQFLREYELGGILADDMGLGKTVQALAHLLVEDKENRADLPSLVVAPTSLMVNWRREAEKFAPSLKVLVLQGDDRKSKFDQINQNDIVLTTYPLLSRDTDILLKQSWHVVILDEAQHIKNPRSKAALTASQLKARQRLCLTGTPMENHLGELWSQFNFLMPGLLGDEKRFRKLFRQPIEKLQDDSRQQLLRKRIAPFMLRRHKSEVATELPPKTEIISEVELNGPQRDLYETIRVSMHSKVRQAIDQKGIARSQIVILDALLKLRQVCCHPQLLKIPSAQKVKSSAKLNQLMEMLPEMVEEGRRILLFSQFTSMLAIIEQELVKKDIKFVKLTGKTRNREQPIDEFQSGKVPVFLISLKAGGSGLNLTAADTVIHYDPWWNPAAENQATDRAHRIGQDKPVFVYKMISDGTVEEKILQMQAKKQALADALFSEGGKSAAISNEDLQALFEPLA